VPAKIASEQPDLGKVSPFSLMSRLTRSAAPKNYGDFLSTIEIEVRPSTLNNLNQMEIML